MSDNLWKKQAQTPKVTGGGNPPPWMKNNNTAGNAPKPPNPPPVSNVPINNKSGPTGGAMPPWMKNKTEGTVKKQAQPPKNTTPQQNSKQSVQPPLQTSIEQSKPPIPSNTKVGGSTPPWMKGKPAASTPKPPPSNVQPWMKDKTGSQNSSKVQQQISDIIKPNQSEYQKNGSILNLEQVQATQKIDDKSNISDDEVIQNDKKPDKKNTKTVKSKKVISSNKSPSPEKRKNTQANTFFNEYLQCFAECFPEQQQSNSYHEKLENQQKLLTHLVRFTDSAKNSIKQYFKERKLMQRKNNFLLLNSQNKNNQKQEIFCKYYLVQSTSPYAPETIQSKSKRSMFKTSNMLLAEVLFQLYNTLFKCITKILKKKNSKKFKLRSPLVSLVQYKGVYFICEAITQELTDAAYTPIHNVYEIAAEVNMLENQLKQIYGEHLPISKKNLQIKKVMGPSDQEHYILYINQNSTEFNIQTILEYSESFFLTPELCLPQNVDNYSGNIALFPSFYSNLEYLSMNVTHISYLDYRKIRKIQEYSTQIKDSDNSCQTDFKQCLQTAHAIRVVYASCQGQIDEPVFWKIMFQGNPGIWKMINNCCGRQTICKGDLYSVKNKHLLGCLLELMIPLQFNQKQIAKSPKKHTKNIINDVSFYTAIYSLQHMQILEICKIFSKYEQTQGLYVVQSQNNNSISSNSKTQLAQKSLQTQQNILKINNSRPYYFINSYTVNKNAIMLLLRKRQYSQAISVVQKTVQDLDEAINKNYVRLIGAYLLAIMCYIFAEGHIIQPLVKKQQQDIVQVQNQEQQLLKNKEPQQQRKPAKQDMQLKILTVFSKLLKNMAVISESQAQFWFHSHIYTILASYYSNKAASLSKGRQLQEQGDISEASILGGRFNQQSELLQTISKHSQTSLKFLGLCYDLIAKYYGNMSAQSASILYQQALCHYQQNNYSEARSILDKAFRIYKPLSKHHRALLDCLFAMGRIQMRVKQVDKAKQILQSVALQYLDLGMAYDAIDVYEYLYANSPLPISYPKFSVNNTNNKASNPQIYVQKQYEIALSYKLMPILHRLNKRIIGAQTKLYPKQKQIALQKLHIKIKGQMGINEQQLQENRLIQLQQYARNYGSCLQMIRWALNTIIYAPNRNQDNQMAGDVIQIVLGIMSDRDIEQMLQ